MKQVFYLIIIALVVYSCGAPVPKNVEEEEEVVLSPIELYHKYVNDKADSCDIFKEDYELFKNYIANNNWQKEVADTNTTPLSLTLISYLCDYPQNAFFLRYEHMIDNAPIDVRFRSSDFDFMLDVNLLCGYLDSSAISEVVDYVLKFHVSEDLDKVLNSKYIIVAQNLEFIKPIVDDEGTYSNGYAKEVVYIFDREADKLFYAYIFDAKIYDEISYNIDEGEDEDLALRSAVYESFQSTISNGLRRSFRENNISLTCIEDNQFKFNFTTK